jgi:hypothetical protein
LALLIIVSLNIFAQVTEKNIFSFCDQTKTITLNELKACAQLTCSDKNVIVKSYFIGEKSPTLIISTGTWDSTILTGINVIGSSFKNQIGPDLDNTVYYTDYLKAGMALYIEHLIVIENGKEKEYPAFSIVVNKIRIKWDVE